MSHMRLLPVSVAVLTVFACVGCEHRAENVERRSITVRGTATATLTPDTITVRVAVVTLDKVPAKSQADNNRIVRAALKLARDAGIAEKDVQTEVVSLTPKWQRGYNQPPMLLGYEATNSITFVLRDISKYDPLLSEMVKAGVNDVKSITFTSSKEPETMRQLRRQAVKDARARAEAMASELGVKVGKVYTIAEALVEDDMWSGDSGALFADDDADDGPTVALGRLKIATSVEVDFELTD